MKARLNNLLPPDREACSFDFGDVRLICGAKLTTRAKFILACGLKERQQKFFGDVLVNPLVSGK
jgi:hypothetical protein